MRLPSGDQAGPALLPSVVTGSPVRAIGVAHDDLGRPIGEGPEGQPSTVRRQFRVPLIGVGDRDPVLAGAVGGHRVQLGLRRPIGRTGDRLGERVDERMGVLRERREQRRAWP